MGVMSREIALGQELSELLGATALSRPEAVSRLWAYCRDNGMLNPENKREIQFDTKLERMMGTSTATMPQLISLLNPHLDYTQTVVKQETKKELKKESGSRGQPVKAEVKKQKTVKGEVKSEQSNSSNRTAGTKCAKHEPVAKREMMKSEAGASASKRMKHEPGSQSVDVASVEEALSITALRI